MRFTCRELYESRGSRTFLRRAVDEIPMSINFSNYIKKKWMPRIICLIILVILAFPDISYAQGIMIPTGRGSWGNRIFIGAGLTYPQTYSNKPDMVTSFGVGLLNPYKSIGFQINCNIVDVSALDAYTFGFKIHKYFGLGTTMSIGGNNLIKIGLSDAADSYYMVLSHDLKYNYSADKILSRVSFSIGCGVGGVFSEKSPMDIAKGKSKHGTYVFGALQYEINKYLRYQVEWSGINLNTGITIRGVLKKIPLGISICAADLTSYSGDRVRFLISIGTGYKFI
jgi:hypothetical protein